MSGPKLFGRRRGLSLAKLRACVNDFLDLFVDRLEVILAGRVCVSAECFADLFDGIGVHRAIFCTSSRCGIFAGST